MALRPTRFESTYIIGENTTAGGTYPAKATVEIAEGEWADGAYWAASTTLAFHSQQPIVAIGDLVKGLRALADKLEGDRQAMEAFQAMSTVEAAQAAPKKR
jgi:hypothetical protein